MTKAFQGLPGPLWSGRAIGTYGCEIRGHVLALLHSSTGELLEVHETTNIVTNAGDIYHAQKVVGASPTNAFNALHLGTGVAAPAKTDTSTQMTQITGSGLVVAGSYPAANDSDTSNTGRGANVVTWKFSYASSAGPFNAISEGAIAVGSADLAGGAPLLDHFLFSAAFNKPGGGSGSVLTVYINLAQLGV